MNYYKVIATNINNGESTIGKLEIIKLNNTDWKNERRSLSLGKDIKYEEGFQGNNECACLSVYIIAKNKKEAIAKALLKLFWISNIATQLKITEGS